MKNGYAERYKKTKRAGHTVLIGYAATGMISGDEFAIVCPTKEETMRTWVFVMQYACNPKKIKHVVISKYRP